jgi:ABC-type phosphate/phosphonate transport system substrate-binding protein
VAERLASLPMYDLPALRPATDAWWAGLSAHFRRAGVRGVPDRLSRPGEGPGFWLSPDLLFSQSCGYPLVTRLAGCVTLLGTPCYEIDGSEGSDYRSLVIVRANSPATNISDLRGRCCAVNMAGSWSGHHALRLIAGPLIDDGRPAFEVSLSGSHAGSVDALRTGAADFAAVDCVSFGLLSRHEPHRVAGLRILARTPAMPGLPLVAGGDVPESDVQAMQQGLRAAIEDPELRGARDRLRLKAVDFTGLADYDRLSAALQRLEDTRIPPFV